MILALGTADYAVVISMLCVSAIVGLYFRFTGGRQKTTREFLMAGKDMAVLPVAFSLMATYMSAISVLGSPADVYMYGAQLMLWMLLIPLGSIIASHLYLPVFFDMEAATAYEYLERRFGKITRAITSLMFSLQMILYMSVVLYAPSLALNAVTGLSTWGSIVTLAVVCTFYCSLGGLKAVLWTDVFQSLLMYVTIISVVIKGIIDVGGLGKSFEINNNSSRLELLNFSWNLEERYTFWNTSFAGFIFALSTFGTNQAQIQRLLSIRSLKRAQCALYISIPLILLFTFFCYWDGLVIYSMFHDCDPMLRPANNTITSPDQLLPYAVLTLFSQWPGVAGLCIAGVFSASLSTVSSAMNSLTAVTMEDFIRPYCFCKKLTESWAAFVAKLIAIGYGGLCLLLTLVVANFRGVLEASNILFGMIAGPVLGIFSLGILTTTTNESGALLGLFSGFLFNAWIGFGSYSAQAKVPHWPRSIEGCPEVIESTDNRTVLEILAINESNQNFAEENKDIFSLYKIAFLWYSVFSTITVIVVGYISSFIIGCIRGREQVKPEYISPVLRKWYFPSHENNEIELSEANTCANKRPALAIFHQDHSEIEKPCIK